MGVSTIYTASTGAVLKTGLSADIATLPTGLAVDSAVVITDSPGLIMVYDGDAWQQVTIGSNDPALARINSLFLLAPYYRGGYQTVAAVAGSSYVLHLGYNETSNFTLDVAYDVAQVETATVGAGTVSADPGGSATITVTSAGMAGSPLAISVPLLKNDVTNTIATKIKAVLNATSVITERFLVGGTGATVTLTRTPAKANDSTLNIAIATGTATGVTAVPSSANTTAGAVATKAVSLDEVPTKATVNITVIYTAPAVINWPAEAVWATGEAPTFTAGKTYIVTMTTADAGGTWAAMVNGTDNVGYIKHTGIGGIAISMLNNTGAPAIKGTIVQLDTVADDGVKVAVIDCDMPIGVVYESGAVAGAPMWVVVSGYADVLMKNTIAPVRGYVALCSSTAGRADVSATVPAAATHDREIGHVARSATGGTDVLARMVLHFR